MDRQIVYPGAIPLETDLLNTNKNAMIGLSKLAAAILGTSTFLNGLACTPTGPASLQVYVAPGEIYSLQNVDGTAYSSIAADTTHAILKQGISLDQLTLSCPAPVTAGQSINYLIQVAYQDTDANSTVLPYYNSSNPSQAYAGPANSGTAQNTVRKGVCAVSAKAGVSATTGSQTTPAPDAGYIGAFVVTVDYGQTQITAPNISAYANAPFLPSGGLVVGGLQGNACNISAAGGTADAITGSYTPGITALTNGMTLYVRAGSANATTTPTFTPNSGSIAAKQIVKGAGAAVAAGDIAGAGHWIELQYDLALDKWVLLNPAIQSQSIAGASKNLVIKNNTTTPNTKVDLAADELVLKSATGVPVFVTSLALTGDIAASGAGGIDTGAKANTTWYAIWAINNGTTTNLLFSLSFTAPTMPGGYGFKALVGAVRTDSSGNFVKFWQYQNRVHTQQQNALNNGGAASANVYQALSIAVYVPPNAKRCFGLIGSNSTTAGDGWANCAADANGSGKSGFNAAVFNQTGTGGFSQMSPFDTGISNPQNLYWTQEVTGSATVKIDITGYEF